MSVAVPNLWDYAGAMRKPRGIPAAVLTARTVRRGGCLLWIGSLSPKGYGLYGGGRAHRLVWAAKFGPIPRGLFVLHRCDTPACVRLKHLFLGTTDDNMADMVSKGRSPVGERNPRHVLSWESVRAMRERFNTTAVKAAELAAEYGVSVWAVRKLLHNKTWHDASYVSTRYASRNVGAANAAAKLTARDVAAVRRFSGNPKKLKALARRRGVAYRAIREILSGRKH